MKKTKKILALILSLAVIAGSVVYTVVGAEDATTGFHNGDVSYNRTSSDNGWLNISIDYTQYQFMQTKDNEQFAFNETMDFQKNRGSSYTVFQYFNLYTGDLSVKPSEKYEQYPLTDMNNYTSDFLNTYNGNIEYVANDVGSTSDVADKFPSQSFEITGSGWDFSGCTHYNWDGNVTFSGNNSSTHGAIDTGFWRELCWVYADGSGDSYTRVTRYARILTKIDVTDVRELIKLVAEARATLNDAGTSAKKKENIQNILNMIPADMLNGSVYYEQSVVDNLYDSLNSVADNIADYSDYDTAYRRAQYIIGDNEYTNHYTKDSLAAFATEIERINSSLSRNLGDNDAGTQKIAEAVQAINDAYQLLVNATATSSGTYEMYGTTTVNNIYGKVNTYTKSPTDNYGNTFANSFLYVFYNNTTHNFMQLTDGERLSYKQTFTAFRNIKGSDDITKIYGFDFDYSDPNGTCDDDNHSGYAPATTVNNTSSFTSRLDSSVYNGTALTSWVYNSGFDTSEIYSKYPSPDNQYDAKQYVVGPNTLVPSSGVLLGNKDEASGIIGVSSSTYAVYSADGNYVFYGNDYDGENNTSTSTGSYTLSYYQRLRWGYRDSALIGQDYTDRDVHIGTTINVTDCRQFIEDYYDARYLYDTIKDSDLYTKSSVKALWDAIVAGSETATGNVYKSQSVVDSEDRVIVDAMNGIEYIADYSEYNEVYAAVKAVIDNGGSEYNVSPSVFNTFKNTVETIDSNLNKDLSVDNQSVVDEATEALRITLEELKKRADYTEFDKAYTKLSEIDTSSYSSAVKTEITNALNVADGLNKMLPADRQDDVDAVTEILLNAIKSATREDLQKKIQEAENTNTTGKADETVKDLEDAIEDGKDVLNKTSPEATLEELEEAIQKLQDAIDGLQDGIKGKENGNTTVDRTKTELDKNLIIVNKGDNTVSGIISSLDNDANYIKVFTFEESDITNDATRVVGTAGTVRLYNSSDVEIDRAYVVVLGDVDGDGDVDDTDYAIATTANLQGPNYSNKLFEIANDIFDDGVIDVLDTTLIERLKNK